MSIELVWYKRDLRVRDHAPLLAASERGPVLPLYLAEPSVLHAPDYDACHWRFTAGCLAELREQLRRLGQPLVVRTGEAVDVLQVLHAQHRIARIWAHEETGNAVTYARDRAVAQWARTSGVELREFPSGGVVRRLRSRDGWSRLWEQRMAEPVVAAARVLRPVAGIDPGPLPHARDLGLGTARRPGAQDGGESVALAMLDSFFAGRGDRYHREMSSPVTAASACSRLSPYLAYGAISTRQVTQRLRAELAAADDTERRRAWRALDARLHWRDHFMQKLEDEPPIEFENFVRGFDGLRDAVNPDPERLAAWSEGRTGYPMIDACMRCLHETGWINFRMRAMLMSFAAYHLWLHWRPAGLVLARLFTDYEPGIHWSQCQMQSGTTGINTLRIYNPLKQAEDHDPDGAFVRRWVPELRPGGAAGRYPAPIVEHASAVRLARARIGEFRRRTEVREQIAGVAHKHGSRKQGRASGKPRRAPAPPPQLDLFAEE
ncbi:MAG: deoxyribodipyrimidine photo-lyase [Bryobacterales bacterium]|nr:deoxyribodipyrimidine photo-lyase [Bryobacterales bacterium]